jgi:hypothetical protein
MHLKRNTSKQLFLFAAVALLGAACGGSTASSGADSLSGRLPDNQVVLDGDRALLRGVVTAATPTSSLTIAGVRIDTSQAQFRNFDDSALTASAFFAAVQPGVTVVKVRWRPFVDVTQPIEEAELDEHQAAPAGGVTPGPGGCPAGLELDDGVCKPHGGVPAPTPSPGPVPTPSPSPAPSPAPGVCPPGLELDNGVCKPHGG